MVCGTSPFFVISLVINNIQTIFELSQGTFKEETGSVYMDTKNLDTGPKDAISWLPHEVLGDILSLVPTKLAASTSLLSKKWRNVFALVHNLDFDDSVLLQPEEGKQRRDVIKECFRNFVDRTLALQCASPLKKFSLKCHYDHDSELAHVVRWVCNALDRGVLELGVNIKPRWDPVPRSETGVWQLPVNIQTHGDVFLPHALFTSKTLVKLTLGTRVAFGKLPPDLSLPALKSLCPVLEELFVRHKQYVGLPYCISSQTIEKLSVQYYSDYDLDMMIGMSFDAPSLLFLDYSDYALSLYPQVNLKSLVEARLDLRYSKIIKRPDISGLFIGISNIKTMRLSANSVDVISRCVKHGLRLPVFNNLVSLTFGSKDKRGWRLLPYLLKQSPKLETLIIQVYIDIIILVLLELLLNPSVVNDSLKLSEFPNCLLAHEDGQSLFVAKLFFLQTTKGGAEDRLCLCFDDPIVQVLCSCSAKGL
ncbi:F-box-like domain superfamily [Arabidopsis suecica]|uniref:F-box-like domain superfamily n=1 Tax=Arabidopsis suecica TaxID=45249 RepID=A0A8T2A1Y8_ARASU|nr:F-box-like domain superfamily [Arabidopsis suecica]